MRAVRFDEYGDASVLEVRNVDVMEPGSGEVLVKVFSAGINPGEIAIREGRLKDTFPAHFPEGQGSDFAGRVARLGRNVEDVKVGDRVIGMSDGRNAQAEYVAIGADRVVSKPDDLQWDTAGALYVVGTTAESVLLTLKPVKDEVLIVSGAAGGVGFLVCQLARRTGARVIGIASDEHAGLLRGVDVEQAAYGDGLIERLRKMIGSDGVDAFADCHGSGYVDMAVTLGVRPERINTTIDFEGAKRIGANAHGMVDVKNPASVVERLARLLADGELFLPIRASFPLALVRDAYEELGKGHGFGKIVLRTRASQDFGDRG